MKLKSLVLAVSLSVGLSSSLLAEKFDYRVLATTKTSTMEREMNQAADAGFAFGGVMGGESAAGGKEVLVVMAKAEGKPSTGRKYVLIAASKTGTLQKELQQAGDEGFQYCGQTIFESALGGREVSIILEHQPNAKRVIYQVLATSKTSTMEKKLKQAGDGGFQFLSVVVGKTLFGGNEVISILQKVVN